jgi:hypothetical protein
VSLEVGAVGDELSMGVVDGGRTKGAAGDVAGLESYISANSETPLQVK